MSIERYEVVILEAKRTPLVIFASSEAEARESAERLLLADLTETPEAVGDPIRDAPRICSVEYLGE